MRAYPATVNEAESTQLARRAVEITLNEYRAGTQNFTTVVTAQALQLNNEVAALQVRLSRRLRGVAPGQAVVLYDGTRVVGSATITSTGRG